MHQWTALHFRKHRAIQIFGELLAAHDKSAPRAAKRFVRRAGYKFRVRDRRWMHAGSYKAGDMSDIHHHQSAIFFSHPRKALEVDRARIGARAHDDQFGFVFARKVCQFVIIDQF